MHTLDKLKIKKSQISKLEENGMRKWKVTCLRKIMLEEEMYVAVISAI